jgi:ABC-type nickel/cobalt efflux system permease component RcnA
MWLYGLAAFGMMIGQVRRRSKLRFGLQPFLRRFAAIVMMAGAVAFTLQGTLIATSQAATGEAAGHAHGHFHHDHTATEHSHVLAHVHVDGTVHSHAIDDDDGLDEHIKQHGCPCCWNMAVAVGVLPALNICNLVASVAYKLAIEVPTPLKVVDPTRLKRPPRTPSIT